MEKSQPNEFNWTRGVLGVNFEKMFYPINYVDWYSINPNRFSEKRLGKILDKLRTAKVIRNGFIVSFLLLLVFAVSVFVLAFIGSVLYNDILIMMTGACAGIGIGILKEYLIEKFPIRKYESGLFVWHKGKKYDYMDRVVN